MDELKQELDALACYIHRVRREIAAIDHPVDDDHRFETMGEQMDAIVRATESATNTIMEATESSEDAIAKLGPLLADADQIALLDIISNNAGNVFEACSFQDITGQRVSRVAKSIVYVEERLNTLMMLMGVDEVNRIEVEPAREKSEDEALLNGPQIEGRRLMQSDIDKLFD